MSFDFAVNEIDRHKTQQIPERAAICARTIFSCGDKEEEAMNALTAALEAINAAVPADAPENQLLTAARCRALAIGYDARWAAVPMKIISVEAVAEAGLYNPDTERLSRTFTLAGKKDVTVIYEGQQILIDHKTTSDDIEDPDSAYWRQLAIEAQPAHYMLIDWLRGQKIDYAVWDVVRRPAISPRDISAADHNTALATGAYCGYTLTPESVAALRTAKRETLEMYTARLADDCIRRRPGRYFQRRAVPRLDHQILEHAREVWDLSQEIISARRKNRWFRNPKACMNFGTPCRFLGICSGHDTPDSEKWIRKNQVHHELPTLAGDGRDVLTFTRLSTYQTCRRKHWFDYELGIERVDEDKSEALFFGNLWHLALEHWFSARIGNGDDNDDTSADTAAGGGVAAIDADSPADPVGH